MSGWKFIITVQTGRGKGGPTRLLAGPVSTQHLRVSALAGRRSPPAAKDTLKYRRKIGTGNAGLVCS